MSEKLLCCPFCKKQPLYFTVGQYGGECIKCRRKVISFNGELYIAVFRGKANDEIPNH